jgi:hypothetical protein
MGVGQMPDSQPSVGRDNDLGPHGVAALSEAMKEGGLPALTSLDLG